MKKTRKKKPKGTPTGYKHIWGYRGIWKETKKTPTTWKINFTATKNKKSKGYGKFRKGFKVHWKIIADQYAIKTGKGTYQTKMIGTKKLISTGNKKRGKRRWKKY